MLLLFKATLTTNLVLIVKNKRMLNRYITWNRNKFSSINSRMLNHIFWLAHLRKSGVMLWLWTCPLAYTTALPATKNLYRQNHSSLNWNFWPIKWKYLHLVTLNMTLKCLLLLSSWGNTYSLSLDRLALWLFSPVGLVGAWSLLLQADQKRWFNLTWLKYKMFP